MRDKNRLTIMNLYSIRIQQQYYHQFKNCDHKIKFLRDFLEIYFYNATLFYIEQYLTTDFIQK